MKYYPHLNDLFISDHLKRVVADIDRYPITTITAPMGYGKTTCINWWTGQQLKKEPDCHIYRQNVYTDSCQEFWEGACRQLSDFPELIENMEALGFPEDPRMMSILINILHNYTKKANHNIYYIIDDIHLIKNQRLTPLMLFISQNITEKIHIILISRNSIFEPHELMYSGSKIYQISAEDLRFNEEDLKNYVNVCGIDISDDDVKALSGITEGWISMIYLNLRTYVRTGSWITGSDDIFDIIEHLLLTPLRNRQRQFIITMGICDEFTIQQAVYMWDGDEKEAAELLKELCRNNAFVTRSMNGIYRYHHMLKHCISHQVSRLSEEEKNRKYMKLGSWFMKEERYIQAAYAFDEAGDYDGIMKALSLDRGKNFTAENIERIYRWARECPPEILVENHTAVLIIMRRMFTYNNISDMLRLKTVFEKNIMEDAMLTEDERNNLLGEGELVVSFLKYNDISAMSEHHRRASMLMNRSSLCTAVTQTWTFGSPSVVMMFHRTSGGLEQENAEMKECMPYYNRVTSGHGYGAELVMEAESYYERGLLDDAEISYRKAAAAVVPEEQYSLLLVAEFLGARLCIARGDFQNAEAAINKLLELLRENHQYMLINTFEIAHAFIHSLLGMPEKISDWVRSGNLETSLIMAPAMPMIHTYYNQVLLCQKKFTELIARENMCREMNDRFHYLMCSIWLEIQLSAAYININGKKNEAVNHMKNALELAMPDGILMPFAENGSHIVIQLRELRREEKYGAYADKILSLSDAYRDSVKKIIYRQWNVEPDYGLTRRELEIAKLAARRMTNREIAEKLNLAEVTVKNRLRVVFDKLLIEGNAKNKRLELQKFFDYSDRENEN